MKKLMLVVCAALAAVFASTTAAGPPATLGTVTIKPLPKTGQAAFWTITASGPLQSGVAKLTVPIYLELNSTSHVTGNMQVAYIELKPVISGGKATVTFLLAANNPAAHNSIRVAQSAREGGDALGMILVGTSGEWTPNVHEESDPCAKFKHSFQQHLKYMLSSSYWLTKSRPGTSAEGLIQLALAAGKLGPGHDC